MLKCLMNKKNGIFKKNSFKIILSAIKSIYFSAVKEINLLIIFGILHSVLNILKIMVSQQFFDVIIKNSEFNIILKSLITFALVFILLTAAQGIHNYFFSAATQIAAGRIQYQIHNKASSLRPIDYEHSELLENIMKAEMGSDCILVTFLTIINILTFYIPYLLILYFYLYRLDTLLPVCLLIMFVPVLMSSFVEMIISGKVVDSSAIDKRKFEYYDECISGRNHFKETRILNVVDFFSQLYRKSLNKYSKKYWSAAIKINIIKSLMSLFKTLAQIAILVLLFNLVSKKRISLGSFAAIFASVNSTIGVLDEVINRHIGGIIKDSSLIFKYIKFMQMKECVSEEKTTNSEYALILDNVCFKYPQSSDYVLKNITFKLLPNETVAIVGLNGSGKTTLAKLLLGIYEPNKGNIFCSCGQSAVFQKFQKYKFSLNDNITISDIYEKENTDKIITLLNDFGLQFTVEDLNLMLSKEFGGTDLSGGQWQRIAMARGVYKKHDMILLDEPTASINPLEESRIFKDFCNLIHATSVIITHRLGSIKLADRIIVMKNGEIIEEGSHSVLYSLKGEYFKIYEAQAKWYV